VAVAAFNALLRVARDHPEVPEAPDDAS
jgi:hypothetical protein